MHTAEKGKQLLFANKHVLGRVASINNHSSNQNQWKEKWEGPPGKCCPEKITSSYDDSFSNAFYAYVLRFYDVFSFYHKA